MENSIFLLTQAAKTIRQLRASNDRMSARLEMFDNVMMLVKIQAPGIGMSHSIDICDDIEKHVVDLTRMKSENDADLKKA